MMPSRSLRNSMVLLVAVELKLRASSLYLRISQSRMFSARLGITSTKVSRMTSLRSLTLSEPVTVNRLTKLFAVAKEGLIEIVYLSPNSTVPRCVRTMATLCPPMGISSPNRYLRSSTGYFALFSKIFLMTNVFSSCGTKVIRTTGGVAKCSVESTSTSKGLLP